MVCGIVCPLHISTDLGHRVSQRSGDFLGAPPVSRAMWWPQEVLGKEDAEYPTDQRSDHESNVRLRSHLCTLMRGRHDSEKRKQTTNQRRQ